MAFPQRRDCNPSCEAIGIRGGIQEKQIREGGQKRWCCRASVMSCCKRTQAYRGACTRTHLKRMVKCDSEPMTQMGNCGFLRCSPTSSSRWASSSVRYPITHRRVTPRSTAATAHAHTYGHTHKQPVSKREHTHTPVCVCAKLS